MKPLNLIIQINEIYCDAKIGKDKHFNAAIRKRRFARAVGILIIVINILIGSTLINSLHDVRIKDTLLGVFAIFAAFLAALQTFLDFGKDVEKHERVGNLYSDVKRDAEYLLSKFHDEVIDCKQSYQEYEVLLSKYKDVNRSSEECHCSEKDYRSARKGNSDHKENIETLKMKMNCESSTPIFLDVQNKSPRPN